MNPISARLPRLARGDKVLILVLLGFSIFGLLRGYLPASAGQLSVVVSVNGREFARRAAALEGQLDVELPPGSPSRLMRLMIQDGRVRVVEEKPLCPKRICLTTGWISRPGQAIVCVPNRVVVRLEGGGRATVPYDALAQ